MRNAVLAACAFVLSAATLQGQEPWANKLFDGVTAHDFGKVPRGAQLTHRFKIRNIYAVPLEITSTRVSCGCVTITPSSKRLEARAEGHIEVLMDARRFTGPKTVSLHISVGPEYISTAILQVSAVSRADIVYNPGQVSFGLVGRGQTPKQSIEVEYAGQLEWQVKEVAQHSAPLDITFAEMYRRPGQVGYRIDVSLKADAPPGTIKEEIFLRTNDPASPLVPVLIEAVVQAPLSVVPDKISLATFRVGETLTKRVIVRGSQPFRILFIEGLGDGINATLPTKSETTQIVTLTCQATKPGELKRQLRIKTDVPTDSTVTLTIDGTAEGW